MVWWSIFNAGFFAGNRHKPCPLLTPSFESLGFAFHACNYTSTFPRHLILSQSSVPQHVVNLYVKTKAAKNKRSSKQDKGRLFIQNRASKGISICEPRSVLTSFGTHDMMATNISVIAVGAVMLFLEVFIDFRLMS